MPAAELILLDAPAAGVNRTLLNELLDAIRRLRDQGKTILLVEHDMEVAMGLCETVFVLDHGEKLAEGAPGVVEADERVIGAYFGRSRRPARAPGLRRAQPAPLPRRTPAGLRRVAARIGGGSL